MNAPWLTKVARIGGLDFHVLLTLIFRSWSIVAGGAMVVFVPVWFTRVEQGYYYTFASLIALQVFFELGMNQVIMQIVGHEAAHVTRTEDGSMSGPPAALGRLVSIYRLLRRWYWYASVGFFAVVSLAGIVFFQTQGELPAVRWLPVWLVVVASTSVTLYLSPSMTFLEGLGEVGQVARARLVQSIAGYVGLWVALSFKAGLAGVVILPLAATAYTAYWLKTRAHSLNWLKRQAPSLEHAIDWRREILPFQWRIAVSWISGYLIFQLFVPIVFSHQGAVEAGRLGIALAIFNALVTVAMSWVNAKVPVFGQLVAKNDRQTLNTLFTSVVVRSTGFATLACLAVVLATYILSLTDLALKSRIATTSVMACLAAATIANSIVFAAAAYMRSHRVEPMLPVSVTCAVLLIPAIYFGSFHSVLLTMAAYMAVCTFVSLPWTMKLFWPFFQRTSNG